MNRPTTLRECARRLVALLDEVGDDVLAKHYELARVVGDVLALPDFDVLGDCWRATATPSSASMAARAAADPRRRPAQARANCIYREGDLRIVRGSVPAGMAQQPHNHGSWNLFGVHRGAVKYRSYRRLDDRSQPYFAELEIAEDRIMRDGEVSVLPGPPHDIHAVLGLAPMTTTVLVARGAFDAVREHYLPEQRCYTHGSDALLGEEAAR